MKLNLFKSSSVGFAHTLLENSKSPATRVAGAGLKSLPVVKNTARTAFAGGGAF